MYKCLLKILFVIVATCTCTCCTHKIVQPAKEELYSELSEGEITLVMLVSDRVEVSPFNDLNLI